MIAYTATATLARFPRTGRYRNVLAACIASAVCTAPQVRAAIQFDDVSYYAGVTKSGETFGAAWGDLNGDGLADLAVNNHRNRDSLLVNRGDGTFLELGHQVHSWVSRPDADTHGAAWQDMDRDGDQDLLVTVGGGSASMMLINDNGELINRTGALGIRYGTNVGARLPIWMDHNGDTRADLVVVNHRRTLAPVFEQSSSSVFSNVTSEMGLACSVFHYAQFYDANNDGKLDLLCGPRERGGSPAFPQRAYDLRYRPFRDITSAIPTIPKVLDTAIGDFDGDLREDVFAVRGVLRPSGVSQEGRIVEAMLMGGKKSFQFTTTGQLSVDLHWNQGGEDAVGPPNIKIGADGWNPGTTTFVLDPADPRVAGTPTYTRSELPVITIGYDRASRTWRFANVNGGSFSNAYFIIRGTADISNLTASGLWAGDKPMTPALLFNRWNGYVDGTAAAGLSAPISCISAVAGDFDNDMDLDIYAACRTGASNIANLMLENRGKGNFVLVSGAAGAMGPTGLAVSRGAGTADTAIVADYNADGFLDLYVANGFNMRPKHIGGPEKLFRNRGNGNRWLEIDLAATYSLADGLGARVYATANGVTQVRTQNGGYHRWAQNDRRLHFGLADATSVDLRVEWPSGITQLFQGVSPNRVYQIKETGGIVVATLGQGNPIRCGAPTYSAWSDDAIVVWKDCVSGTWQIRGVAGSSGATYSGTIKSAQSMTAAEAMGFEADDVLNTSNLTSFNYSMNVTPGTQDGFSFKLPASASACMSVNPSRSGTRVVYGPLRVTVPPTFNLKTGRAC